MMYETVDELVKARKGYKYLTKDRTSPYQGYKYIFRKRKIFKADLDQNRNKDCSEGWNLATLKWILSETNILDKIIVEFSIPDDATIIVPNNSSGKFRTDIVRYEKIHQIKNLFPETEGLLKRLKSYKFINPINAEKLPSKKKIKRILKEIKLNTGDSVRAPVWPSVSEAVWDSVRASVWPSVWDSVWPSVWDSVRTPVWASVSEAVWHSVWPSVSEAVRDSVWDSVWAQSHIAGYKAIVSFLKLDFDCPAFNLIRLGIIVVKIPYKFKIFGKNGKYLGEIDDDFQASPPSAGRQERGK